MPSTKDCAVGQRYGRLVVKSIFMGDALRFGRNTKEIQCEVVCDCGEVKTIPVYPMMAGRIQSCGCKRGQKGGSQKIVKPRVRAYDAQPVTVNGVPLLDFLADWRSKQEVLKQQERDTRTAFCHQVAKTSFL